MKIIAFFARRPCCLAVASLIASIQAHAQTEPVGLPSQNVISTPLEYRQFDKVEITGSSIVRKEQTQALPVQVITRQDIQRSGDFTLGEFLQRQPSLFNGMDLAQLASPSGGYTAVALHGMPTGTLILINGKRVAPFGIQALSGKERMTADVSALPLAAVDRIEILADGASTLYGTDAIAGVINIITRDEIRGTEITVEATRPSGGAGQGALASLSWGRGQLQRDGYSLRVTAELESVAAIHGSDRPWASQARIPVTVNGIAYQAEGSRVTGFTSPALLYAGSSGTMYSANFVHGACQGNTVSYRGYAGGCMTSPYPQYDLYPDQRNARLYAMGERGLEGGHTVYAELLYGQQRLKAGTLDWPSISGKIKNEPGAIGYDLLKSAGAVLNNSMYYYWRPDLPARQQQITNDEARVAVGLKGIWQDWDYHASAYAAQSQVSQDYQKVNLASIGLTGSNQRAGNPGYPSNANILSPLNANNPLTAQLESLRQWERLASGQTQLSVAEVRASRPLMEINGRDLLLGVGMEARHEQTQYTNVQSTQPSFSGSRRDVAAYAELQVPVHADVDVIASLRSDQYSDVGNTTNAKLAARWAISPKWALRGAVGSGFRAPTVGQTQVAAENIAYASSTTTCSPALNEVAARLTASTGQQVQCRDNANFVMYTNGNPDLKPEQSRQGTLGLAFTPDRNTNISLDYWQVQMTNTLQLESIDTILANPLANLSSFVPFKAVTYNPGTGTYYRDLAALLRMRNLGESRKEGVDIDMRWRYPSQWGRITLGMQATRMLSSQERVRPEADLTSDLGAYSETTTTFTPRWRARLSAGLSRDMVWYQLMVNHRSGYTDKNQSAFNTQTQKTETLKGHQVSGFTTLDLLAGWDITRQTQLRAGLRNALNRQPPFSFYTVSPVAWGVSAQDGELMGRAFTLSLTHRF